MLLAQCSQAAAFELVFSSLPYAALLLNCDFYMVWQNEAAQTFFSAVPAELLLRQAFSAQELALAKERLCAHEAVQLQTKSPLGESLVFLLSPLFEADVFCGCTLLPQNSFALGVGAYPQGNEQVLSTFSHQMRSPLSSVFTSLQGLTRCNDTLEDPDVRTYIGKISSCCYRLLRTNAGMTQAYRLEHAMLCCQLEKQDLSRFLDQLCRVVSVTMERLRIRFSFFMPPEPIVTLFDAEYISVALLHLISNSAKFRAEDSEISVTLSCGAHSALISVADNGLGVENDVLPHVFEPYYSHDPRTAGVCGDGLGLFIAQAILQQHGGTLALESRPGGGTNTVFSLPLRDDPSATLTVKDVANGYLYDHFSNLYVILSDVCQTPLL